MVRIYFSWMELEIPLDAIGRQRMLLVDGLIDFVNFINRVLRLELLFSLPPTLNPAKNLKIGKDLIINMLSSD